MSTPQDFSSVIDALEANEQKYSYFCKRIVTLLEENPDLTFGGLNCVHTIRSRKKSRASIISKCSRKAGRGIQVTPTNCFDEIEDLFGIRLLHLHLDQLPKIHGFLTSMTDRGDFIFGEKPKAYTWDPEYRSKLVELGFDVEFKDSLYTSVHYILRNETSPIRCELQVRTLFEEVWGELDHWMNYPVKTESIALREQLSVLSRVVTAGSRLAVSIHRIHVGTEEERTTHENGAG